MSDADASAATPFELLGHDIRIGIVEALVEHRREHPDEPALTFSELRDRVGVADSGQFNYHLDKLRGQFVRETDAGYRLGAAGRQVAGAVLSGSYDVGPDRGPVDLDATCGYCDASVAVRYEDGALVAECDDGHTVHSDYFPSGIVERVSLPAAMELSALLGHHKVELLLRDVCPSCYGPATATVERAAPDGRGEGPYFRARCEQCGFSLDGPPGLAVLPHPALLALYLDHDRDVRTAFLWSLPFLVDRERWWVEEETPLRVGVEAAAGDERVRFLVDGDCSVVRYERDPTG